LAIGHTRWATHGRPSNENAHPHRADDVVVVHNGIIENYATLAAELQAQGRNFESDTDTEIIAHLIAVETGDSLRERVEGALSRVRGAYAIAVISSHHDDEIVVAKNASPLCIGVTADACLCASDIPALLPFTRRVVILEEGNLAVLRPGKYELWRIDPDHGSSPIERQERTIEWSPVMAEKDGHRHFMHKEMHEQPRAIADTLRGRLGGGGDGDDTNIVSLDPEAISAAAAAERIIFTACGTSWHACLLGRLFFEELARVGCEVELASELRYRHPLLGKQTLTLAVSQSGETADTLAAVGEARKLSSQVLSVVNVLDSSIARASDHVIYTRAGPEIGVASTKAFTTQVATLCLLAVATALRRGTMHVSRAEQIIAALRELPRHIETVLQQEDTIAEIATRISGASSALFLGRGYGFPVALEGALKLKEVSYIHAEGYAAGEMKHGPIALIEKGLPVVAVAQRGRLFEKMMSNMQEVAAREAYLVAVVSEGDELASELSDAAIAIPDTDPMVAAILASVPLQLLAYHVAICRGTDVDQPRNLAKSVTVE